MKKLFMSCVLLFTTTLFVTLNANGCYTSQSSANVTVWVGKDGNIYGTNRNNQRIDVAVNIKYDDGTWSGKKWFSMVANENNDRIFNARGTAVCFYIIDVLKQHY